jgi:hypothetical protein
MGYFGLKRSCGSSLAAFMLVFAHVTCAAVKDAGPEEYRQALKTLQPGDTLRLQAGVYREGLPLHRLSGTAGAPIVITGPENGPAAAFLARAGHNTVSILNARFVTVRNLELDGANLPVDGVKCEGHAELAHHITIENLTIHSHGNNQQTVAISTKCPAWNWVIRGNTIVGAGTGIYLGNSDGSAPFVAGLIEHNLIVDTLGYNLQIKHQKPRPELPGMPVDPSTTIIRHNVFSKEHGASGDPMARPNVLLGHWPLAGPGKGDYYQVYGNFFYDNPTEALFQGEGNITLHHNVFWNPHGDAIHIQPHNDVPKRITVAYNTVLAAGAGIVVRNRETGTPHPQIATANAVFAAAPVSGIKGDGNVHAPLTQAEEYLIKPFAPLGTFDPRPLPGRLKLRKDIAAALPELDIDFDGYPRRLPIAGAYGNAGEAPVWLPRLEIKPR